MEIATNKVSMMEDEQKHSDFQGSQGAKKALQKKGKFSKERLIIRINDGD